MSNMINRVEASTLFVAVKKLGMEEKISMDLACMAMKAKLDSYHSSSSIGPLSEGFNA